MLSCLICFDGVKGNPDLPATKNQSDESSDGKDEGERGEMESTERPAEQQ